MALYERHFVIEVHFKSLMNIAVLIIKTKNQRKVSFEGVN
jgi:hypothetical protein